MYGNQFKTMTRQNSEDKAAAYLQKKQKIK